MRFLMSKGLGCKLAVYVLSAMMAIYPFHSFGIEPTGRAPSWEVKIWNEEDIAYEKFSSGEFVEFNSWPSEQVFIFDGSELDLDGEDTTWSFVKPGGIGMFDGYSTKAVSSSYDSEFCTTTKTITSGALTENDCITVKDTSGQNIQICPGDEIYNQLSPSPIPGVPKLSLEVDVYSDCNDFNVGPMDCWVDIHGETQCPENEGDRESTCDELEADPQCAFISSECIEGALGEESGHCYAYEDTYDCGLSVHIPDFEKTETYQCGGPVRCMGDDCLDPMKPPSAADDFGKVAALLDAAQSMAEDMECNLDGTGCKVFSGNKAECKRALGGWVNCCEKPKGVSLSDYITTIRKAPAFDKAMQSLAANDTSAFNFIGQGYTSIRNPLANGFRNITSPVSGYMENISGAYKGLKQQAGELVNKVAMKAKDVIGKAMGKSAANQAGQQAAASGAESLVNSFMASPAGIFLSTVMMIYTIYQIANLIVNIIWKCSKKELELGAQRQLRSCSKVGTYCKKKVLGACIEKRTSFCCFSSPLTRILQEQIRPQLGMNFGRAKSPNCSGLPIDQLDRVDWDRVNLDEWLGILQLTDNFPGSTNMTIESMTGAGSRFDFEGDRKNSLDRNIERLEGADIDAARDQAGKTVPITTGAPTRP